MLEKDTGFDTLAHTEGYFRLTPLQRKIIKISFLVQQRANRNAHVITGAVYSSDNDYKLTCDHIITQNCYSAVSSLETGLIFTDPDSVLNSFFEADYQKELDYRKLGERIKSFGFPCAVHCAENVDGMDKEILLLHSFVALGTKAETDEIVAWEKEGFTYPYRQVTLKGIFDRYGDCYWGIRKLKSGGV